jgi:AraC-like DNA-binding protein
MPETFRRKAPEERVAGPAGVPLVRAGQLAPFVSAAERLGVRTERYLDRVRVPASVLQRPQQLIARARVWGFADRIAREQGVPDLGLEAAAIDPVTTLGAFGRRLLTMPTLFMALAQLAREFGRHSTHVRFRIEEVPGGIGFIRHDAGYVRGGSDVVEQYTLMLLISVIRRAVPEWRPERLWLRSIPATWSARHDLFADAEPARGSPVTGIYVPRHILARPMGRHRFARDADAAERLGLPDGFLASLKHALQPLVGTVPLDLALAAEMVGASPRTVRLRLREEGTSWRRLLDELRFEYTRTRLIESDASLGDIAFELGYADAAHFTRAFRRWTKVTPSEFRAGLREP